MALTQQIDRIDTIIATGAITEKTFVGYDGDTCGANAKAVGVAVYDASTGDAVSIAQEGRVIITAGGAVAVGDPVTSDASGKAVAAADVTVTLNAGGSTDNDTATVAGGVLPVAINGYARTAASTDGDLIELDLR